VRLHSADSDLVTDFAGQHGYKPSFLDSWRPILPEAGLWVQLRLGQVCIGLALPHWYRQAHIQAAVFHPTLISAYVEASPFALCAPEDTSADACRDQVPA